MRKRILISICIVESIIILILIGSSGEFDEDLKRSNILNITSPDNNYKIIVNEIGEAYPLGSSEVELIVTHKVENEWEGRMFIRFDIANEGGVSKDNFSLEWFEEGAIIHVQAGDQADCSYRVYWNDLFSNN